MLLIPPPLYDDPLPPFDYVIFELTPNSEVKPYRENYPNSENRSEMITILPGRLVCQPCFTLISETFLCFMHLKYTEQLFKDDYPDRYTPPPHHHL